MRPPPQRNFVGIARQVGVAALWHAVWPHVGPTPAPLKAHAASIASITNTRSRAAHANATPQPAPVYELNEKVKLS